MLPSAPGTAAPHPDKAVLRARFRAARRARPAEQRAADAAALRAVLAEVPELTAATVVAAYVPLPTEPDVGPAVADLAARGVRVLLPVLMPDRDLDWTPLAWSRDDWEQDNREQDNREQDAGPPPAELLGPDAVADADVLLVPALAADRRGTRLGQGGGSYDRALARARPDALVIAVLVEGELVDALPGEPHDRPVAAVATAAGVVRLPLPPAAASGP